MRDMLHDITIKRVISPVNQGGDVAEVGQIIDRAGYDSVTFAIATGSLADAGATFTVLLEDGDNSALADAAAVADGYMVSQGTSTPEADASFTQADDNEVRVLGYTGLKRYLRLTITPAGNASDAYMSAVAILGHRVTKPFTQPAS